MIRYIPKQPQDAQFKAPYYVQVKAKVDVMSGSHGRV